ARDVFCQFVESLRRRPASGCLLFHFTALVVGTRRQAFLHSPLDDFLYFDQGCFSGIEALRKFGRPNRRHANPRTTTACSERASLVLAIRVRNSWQPLAHNDFSRSSLKPPLCSIPSSRQPAAFLPTRYIGHPVGPGPFARSWHAENLSM